MKALHLESGTRLLALSSVTAGILVVTLFPVRPGLFAGLPAGPAPLSVLVLSANIRYASLLDLIQNGLLFLPFGFLFATFMPAGHRGIPRLALTCLAGLCLSGGVEALQSWIPGRYPTLSDVFLNGLGALGGAMAAGRLAQGRSRSQRPRTR